MVLWGSRVLGLLWVLGIQEAEELLVVLGSRVVVAGVSWIGRVEWQK